MPTWPDGVEVEVLEAGVRRGRGGRRAGERQYIAGQGGADDRIDHVARRYLYNAWNAFHKFRLGHLCPDGEIKFGFLEQTFVLDATDVQRVAGLLQRDRDAAARDNGFEQVLQLGRQAEESEIKIVVVVADDVLRVAFDRKGH